VGYKEFFGREFIVSPAVLCPRPETELLVECALESVAGRESVSFIDLGTGSGCIAVTVAAELARCGVAFEGLAVDQSQAALQIAEQNAARHVQAGALCFQRSNWFKSVLPEMRFDLILSNPPYVEEGAGYSPELAHEPSAALYAAEGGLSEYRTIFATLENYIAADSIALFEIGNSQAAALETLAREIFRSACHISVKKDLAGHDRVLQIRF
jgi:release factor glutamine methyltransferase